MSRTTFQVVKGGPGVAGIGTERVGKSSGDLGQLTQGRTGVIVAVPILQTDDHSHSVQSVFLLALDANKGTELEFGRRMTGHDQSEQQADD